jgi:hypothetical protein
MAVAEKYIQACGRAVISSDDLARAFKCIVNPGFCDFESSLFDTPTHSNALEHFQKRAWTRWQEQCAAWEAAADAGTYGPVPRAPDTSATAMAAVAGPVVSAGLAACVTAGFQVVPDNSDSDLNAAGAGCSDAAQAADPAMYMMENAHRFFEELLRDLEPGSDAELAASLSPLHHACIRAAKNC